MFIYKNTIIYFVLPSSFCLDLTHCTSFFGPFSRNCLNSLWMLARCEPQGRRSPNNITHAQLMLIDSLNAR